MTVVPSRPREAMPAYVWNTNHRMWKVVPPFADSADVLKAYITDPSAYVYWSTRLFHEEMTVGDVAYILCTVDNEGIVARGRVAEAPAHAHRDQRGCRSRIRRA